MKIVYNILGTFNPAGMERVLSNKANYLANLGHDITIITSEQKKRKPFYTLDNRIKLIDLDLNYYSNSNYNKLMLFFLRLYKSQEHKQKLKKILFDIKADIVISMFDHDAEFLYKIKDGSKKILETHFAKIISFIAPRKGIYYFLDIYRAYMRTKLASKYDKFIVLTQEDKNAWGNMPNIKVIPNANSFESSEHANLDSKVAIAVGRYEYQKGYDDLIKVWAIVNKKHPDWKLNIFGQGHLKDSLQNLISDLGLSGIVNLCSVVENIKDEYLRSSMLLMTSKFEGLPMVLLEAQVCGLPLISYAYKCGPRDIIKNNENGFIIDEGDREGMANKIIELIKNEDLRKNIGKKSAEFSKNFTKEKIMKSWIELFEDLISDKQ